MEHVGIEEVRKYGWALEFVEEQTEEICLAAVMNEPYAIQLVKNQTEEICLAAVTREGLALEDVREQSELVCIAACLHTWQAHIYVKQLGAGGPGKTPMIREAYRRGRAIEKMKKSS